MKGSVTMEQYLCPCGYLYNEELGCPSDGIAPGTKFEDIPDDWHCPVCGLTKDYFGSREEIEEAVEQILIKYRFQVRQICPLKVEG